MFEVYIGEMCIKVNVLSYKELAPTVSSLFMAEIPEDFYGETVLDYEIIDEDEVVASFIGAFLTQNQVAILEASVIDAINESEYQCLEEGYCFLDEKDEYEWEER